MCEAVKDTRGVSHVPEEGFAAGAGGGDVGTAGTVYTLAREAPLYILFF